MYFAETFFLWFLILPALFLILKLFYTRFRTKTVSSLLLWFEVDLDKSVEKGKVHIPLSTLLQTVALVLAVLALSEPHIFSKESKSPDVCIFFDNSASISSFESEQKKTRYEILKTECEKILDEIPDDSSVTFHFISSDREKVETITTKKRESAKVLNSIRPTPFDDRLLSERIQSVILEKPAIFYLFSDKILFQDKKINYVLFGKEANNVSIEYVDPPQQDKPYGFDLKIFLKNFSEKDVKGTVTINLKNKTIATQSVLLKSKSSELISVSLREKYNDDVEIKFISPEDNLNLDNIATVAKSEKRRYELLVANSLPEILKNVLLKIGGKDVKFFDTTYSITGNSDKENILFINGNFNVRKLDLKSIKNFVVISPSMIEGILFCTQDEQIVTKLRIYDDLFTKFIDISKIKFAGVKNIIFQTTDNVVKILTSEKDNPLICVLKKQEGKLVVLNFSLQGSLVQDESLVEHPYLTIFILNLLNYLTNGNYMESEKERVIYKMRDSYESNNSGVIQNFPSQKLDYQKIEYKTYDENLSVYFLILALLCWFCGIFLEIKRD